MNGSKPDFYYALAIRSKKLDLTGLLRGRWTLMLMANDFDEVERRYKMAQRFLHDYMGEIVVFKINGKNIGEVRVIGLVGAVRAPRLEDIMQGSEGLHKRFWRESIESQSGFKSRPAFAQPKQGFFERMFN